VDNEVTFRVSGEGRLIGTGNGDPTNQEPDKGASRKAFSGFCMALVQSLKTAGSITVEASSPGLDAASVTIAAKSVALRPQVDVWQRQVPEGEGITGLWRPEPAAGISGAMSFFVGDSTMVFALRQNGSELAGNVEGNAGGFFGGNDAPIEITDGKVDGNSVSFKVGNSTYAGKLNGDRIELERSMDLRFLAVTESNKPKDGLAIGPPPDGSDPSRGAALRLPAHGIPVVLRRAQR
jgi:beta-galactosidase